MLKKEIDLADTAGTVSEAAPSVHRYSHTLISRQVIQSSQIPIDARMLLVYLTSFKEGWTFYDSKIRKDLGIGFSKLKTLFKQLRKLGYVKTVPVLGEGGRMQGSKRMFSSEPEFINKINDPTTFTESMEIRKSVKQTAQKSEPKITNSIIKDVIDINKIKINKKKFDKEFSEFWEAYDKKCGKEKCMTHYNKILSEEGIELHQKIIGALHDQWSERSLKDCLAIWQPPKKMPQTWLNGRCWEDEVQTEEKIREEYKRSIQRNSGQPIRESKIDRQFRILDEFEQAASNKQRAIQNELARATAAYEQAQREECGSPDRHSCY